MNQMKANQVEKYLQEHSDASIIDVREVKEVRAGKIPGAVNIPLRLLEFRMQDLDKTKKHVLICRSGSRSALAGRVLEKNGFQVINVDGGMLEWENEQRKIFY
ncbi:rhodanese-like domain-containing protein [Alkalicoccus daliensis]|uniref:Rhodanese-related sulfurtransferase n=1 Tax=Alkalicoccus daliensis TaxID=745820 RepID=A0A1H0D9S6_9BACI|nr:rhodanese-like domain-containing protein [Alkalicoccus daliensis]SDN66731.1 Rhodanese-related sulfurtransferase [Alkalicoccus daliensis]